MATALPAMVMPTSAPVKASPEAGSVTGFDVVAEELLMAEEAGVVVVGLPGVVVAEGTDELGVGP